MRGVTQFGSIFSAYGAFLDYVSEEAKLQVLESGNPVLDQVLEEIQYFEQTENNIDGAAALVLADTIDGEPNPLTPETRENVLHALHLKKHGVFVYQVLAYQLSNRSWHVSQEPNQCTYFGELCTHRGINQNTKGRKSERQPDEFHKLVIRTNRKTKETFTQVAREQLITPALKNLFESINPDNLISGEKMLDVDVSIRQLRVLPLAERLRVIEALQEEAS